MRILDKKFVKQDVWIILIGHHCRIKKFIQTIDKRMRDDIYINSIDVKKKNL